MRDLAELMPHGVTSRIDLTLASSSSSVARCNADRKLFSANGIRGQGDYVHLVLAFLGFQRARRVNQRAPWREPPRRPG